jgi:hypothetical protein
MKQQAKKMVALLGLVLPVLGGSSSYAATVSWKGIAGVISTADDALTDANESQNNPVGKNINSGTFPWTVQSGRARVNLATGATTFQVRGLNIVGNFFSGTPGPVNAIEGTLVCNPADDQNEMILDTSDVKIDGEGNASFNGKINGIPATCNSPVFLLRIATINTPNPEQARGAWIATGTQRVTKN